LEMLDVLRDFQRDQLARNQSFIENLPPEVKARIPDKPMELLEGFYAMIYADAIQFCRTFVEAEKQKASKFTGVMVVPDGPAPDFRQPNAGPIRGKPDVVFKDETTGKTVDAGKFKRLV
jgi:hypothetical protein